MLRNSGVPAKTSSREDKVVRRERIFLSNSFHDYVKEAWEVIDPEPFVDNWHIGAVCYYLEALTSREIKRCVFNLPPGLAKSLLVSVMWPTWEWTKDPRERYLFSAYGQELSVRDTKRSRDLIRSPWYQERWGHLFDLDTSQDTKTYYENTLKGSRKATSVGGGGTGTRARTLVLDDPHKLEEFYHPDQMATAVQHKNDVLGTRGGSKDTRKVVMMQRVGPLDVTEDIMNKMEQSPPGEHYEFLVLPMRHEPSVQLDMMKYNELPWKDPRIEEGELLHPNLYDERFVVEQEVNLLDRAPVVLQQHRGAAGGSIFDRNWWNPVTRPHMRFDINSGAVKNDVYERYLIFDTAFEDKETSSYTGKVVLELMKGSYRVNLRHASRNRVHFPDLLDHIEAEAEEWNYDGLLADVVIENKASGISAVQTLVKTAPAWLADRIVGFVPPGSKDEKCRQAAVYCKLGGTPLPYADPNADWLTWFTEEELFKVPHAKFRDVSDAYAVGILYLENFLEEAVQDELSRLGSEQSQI